MEILDGPCGHSFYELISSFVDVLDLKVKKEKGNYTWKHLSHPVIVKEGSFSIRNTRKGL